MTFKVRQRLLAVVVLGLLVIYSPIVSCRRRGINPEEYLTDVPRRLLPMKITAIGDRLPGSWKPLPLTNR